MKKSKKQFLKVRFLENQGITLVALIVTIIILFILAGVTIYFISGNEGILKRATNAVEETQKQAATEKINFKITNKQMDSYADEQRKPTLQELMDFLNKDDEIEYATTKNTETIVTKLKEYPYEFEIDNFLKITSIDGIASSEDTNSGENTSTNNPTGAVSSEQYEEIQETITNLNRKIETLESTIMDLSNNMKNYATIEYADSLPQNSGNYTDLNWTLIGSNATASWVKVDANIDDYNYISLAYENNGCIMNPVIISVKQFKTLCYDYLHSLESVWDSNRGSFAYYDSGIYFRIATVQSNCKALVYGLK